MDKRGQSAIEFLVTYGWAILIGGIAVVAISYLGAFRTEKFIPEICVIEPGIGCPGFNIHQDSLKLQLTNSKGENLVVSGIQVQGCNPNNEMRLLKSGETGEFVVDGCNNEVKERYKGEVKMSYTKETGLAHTAVGEVQGIVAEAVEIVEAPPGVVGGEEGGGEEVTGLTVASGKQRYFVRSNPNSPQFLEVTIDPLDVHVGDNQTMSVWIRDQEAPITQITAAVETDTGIRTYLLTLIDGTNQDGTWTGSWIVRDTHSREYTTNFTAKNSLGEISSTVLTWSDPCAPPTYGAWTLDDNCGISGVQGVENGSTTIAGYTMSVHAGGIFVWNHGQSIQVTTGAIALADGAQLRQSYIWMSDYDRDGVPTNTTMFVGDTAPGGDTTYFVRRYNITTYSSYDVNDTYAGYYQNLSCYIDADMDGYKVGSAANQQSGGTCPSGYVLAPTDAAINDCNDNNNAVC
ncbi:hypothetical protein HYX09_04175 [Candidatus Woesearchaeota archaeon]|nr:hypothetical protein [Candidatus Woesearchaeota archaeon]